MKRINELLVVIALLMPFAAFAGEWQTVYDGQGRVTSRIQTDPQGRQTFYDSAGRVTGRALPGNRGMTTFYDASGRVTGRLNR